MSYEDYFNDWNSRLDDLSKFIDENNKVPSQYSKCKHEKSIWAWLRRQKENYERSVGLIMRNSCLDKWKDFLLKYENYVKMNEKSNIISDLKSKKSWFKKIEKLEEFLDQKKRLPNRTSKEKNLSNWYLQQKKFAKMGIGFPSNNFGKEKWNEFIQKYKDIIDTDCVKNDLWTKKLEIFKNFVISTKRLPRRNCNDGKERILYAWMNHQKRDFRRCKNITVSKERENMFDKCVKSLKTYLKTERIKMKEKCKNSQEFIEYTNDEEENNNFDDIELFEKDIFEEELYGEKV